MIEIMLTALMYLGLYKVFEKAKVKNAWYACIPGLNGFYLAKIGRVSFMVSILSAVFSLYPLFFLFPSSFSGLLAPLSEIPQATEYDTFIIPIFLVLLFGHIRASYCTAKSFGKGVLFSLGTGFLDFMFLPILGFDNSRYLHKNKPVEAVSAI